MVNERLLSHHINIDIDSSNRVTYKHFSVFFLIEYERNHHKNQVESNQTETSQMKIVLLFESQQKKNERSGF